MALLVFFYLFRNLSSTLLTELLLGTELTADPATADKMDTAPFPEELTAQ